MLIAARQKIEDVNALFNNCVAKPIFINDLPMKTLEDRERLDQWLVTTYESSDVLSNMPTCSCRFWTTKAKEGRTCPKCDSIVTAPLTRDLEPTLWIRTVAHVKYLMWPNIWAMLSKPVSTSKEDIDTFNLLEWIGNRNIRNPERNKKASKWIADFESKGLERGWNTIYDNFDDILDIILSSVAKDARQDYIDLCAMRDQFFVKMLPIPSKVAFAVDKTAMGDFYNQTIDAAIEAAYTAATLANISTELDEGSDTPASVVRKIDARITTIVHQLSIYYRQTHREVLAQKPGWFRRVVYGNRANFSWRGVITSRHGPHDYRSLIVPYKQMLTMLKPAVKRKLVEGGMSSKQAKKFIIQYSHRPHDTLWNILEGLINDTPPAPPNPAIDHHPLARDTLKSVKRTGRGIGCTHTRYPSLRRGSTHHLYITGMSLSTTEISVLILNQNNADKLIVRTMSNYSVSVCELLECA